MKTFLHRLRWPIITIYIILVISSNLTHWLSDTPPPVPATMQAVMVSAISGDKVTSQKIQFTYQEYRQGEQDNRPVVVLLHGSPGSSRQMNRLVPYLKEHYRLLLPDLPGFGASTQHIPDYSVRAHAHYVWQLLDQLHIERAHLLGFSMGGGVIIDMADIAPERVTSLNLVAAIGVQENELLGDYYANHALHGLQLAALWLLVQGTPHFGTFDGAISYARNFYDTDQRPLRSILEHYQNPMLIIHGVDDFNVPVEAAQEHARLVPQSEVHILQNQSHFMLFMNPEVPTQFLIPFLQNVDHKRGITRAKADPERLTAAQQPYDPRQQVRFIGLAGIVVAVLLALSTLVSEDLACLTAGVLVAQGRLDFTVAVVGCFLGIYVGDLLIFLTGRQFGQAALNRIPLCWFITPKQVAQSAAWFDKRGMGVILLTRVLPGTRFATYFTMGMFKANFKQFALYFAITALIWTPLYIGLVVILGRELSVMVFSGETSTLRLLAIGIAIWLLIKLLNQLRTYRGRRLMLSSWRRLTRWEFWPLWFFYPPVLLYILGLAIKHRSLTLFTITNPAIPASGLVGESKIDILRQLHDTEDYVAKFAYISPHDITTRQQQAHHFMSEHGLNYPIVLKPDVGERGSGVAVIRSNEELMAYFQRTPEASIIQAYAPGHEFGVFYYRHPNETHGHIFSITDKQFPVMVGDGHSPLERLILQDERAVCMARFYLSHLSERLAEIPASGERVQLVELGTHCRGAIFLDGITLKTPALEAKIDQISQRFQGFYFGRYDIRTPNIADFQRGENFKIVELNGVTSEATHIYDPKNSLFDGYRVLFQQWQLAFEIGAANRARGHQPMSLWALARLLWTRRLPSTVISQLADSRVG